MTGDAYAHGRCGSVYGAMWGSAMVQGGYRSAEDGSAYWRLGTAPVAQGGGKTGDGGYCRTNARADRGLCRADARAAFVGIQRAHSVIR
jgi:hypothetical protein